MMIKITPTADNDDNNDDYTNDDDDNHYYHFFINILFNHPLLYCRVDF